MKITASDQRIRYVRYIDDFVILAPSRWLLRRAVRKLNGHLSAGGFEQHLDKTFIGRVAKGFDWMGFWFNEAGCVSVAPRAVNNFLTKLRRLYERVRKQPAEVQAARLAEYVKRWGLWVNPDCRSRGFLRPHVRRAELHIGDLRSLTDLSGTALQ